MENTSEGFPEENKTYIYKSGTLISTKFPEEKIGYIYVNESEFYKDKTRSYMTGMPSGNFATDPLKGEALNSYFKSLNLAEDYIYAMMQFETLGGDPTKEQIQTLADNGITLFEYHGDHTYYAKIPRIVLETKYYDFVRWIGIVENPTLKLHSSLKEILDKNCTGRINLSIEFYENLNDEQFEQVKQLSNGCLVGYKQNCSSTSNNDLIDLEIDVSKLYEITSLNFVKKISFGDFVVSVLGGPNGFENREIDPFENIDCN